MPAPFGSSARRLQGDVRGSAERAKRPHSASSGGFQPSRKSFFQSLDADERAALLKVAPSLRCARRRRPRARTSAVSRPSVSLSARPARPSRRRVEARHARLTLPRPLARFTSVPRRARSNPRAAGTSRPRPGRRRLRSRRPRVESRGDADARREERRPPRARARLPRGSKPEDATAPKPRRPPRASAATTARGTTSTPRSRPRRPRRARARRGAAARRAGVPGDGVPRDARRRGAPAGVSRARGFDLELTRDLAKRESALRFEVERCARARRL